MCNQQEVMLGFGDIATQQLERGKNTKKKGRKPFFGLLFLDGGARAAALLFLTSKCYM
jgi:hypothetical protein